MKLSLKVFKEYLLLNCEEEFEVSWINNNISDEEVSVREMLDMFGKWWSECIEEWGGDSEELVSVLVNGYKLNDEDCNIIMKEYWEENEFEYNYDEYRW